jgi:flagellar biosynthetic protein FlhB
MRMSRREVRRELRDREGEPRLKQKRKQMHAEFVRLAQSVRNIRKADVLIVNPQHLAVALQYDPRTMTAPRVVSLGTGHLALRLKRLAFLYGVPTVENRPLAWAIYRKGALNMPIPEPCYRPVADIYNRIRKPAPTQQLPQPAEED